MYAHLQETTFAKLVLLEGYNSITRNVILNVDKIISVPDFDIPSRKIFYMSDEVTVMFLCEKWHLS